MKGGGKRCRLCRRGEFPRPSSLGVLRRRGTFLRLVKESLVIANPPNVLAFRLCVSERRECWKRRLFFLPRCVLHNEIPLCIVHYYLYDSLYCYCCCCYCHYHYLAIRYRRHFRQKKLIYSKEAFPLVSGRTSFLCWSRRVTAVMQRTLR